MTAAPRRAALMAHALAPPDQAWLLEALSPGRKDVLQGLLAELVELGIPPDVTLLQDLKPRPVFGAAALENLERGQVRLLATLLQREPPAITARLLAMRTWQWRDALLAAMEDHFVRQLRQHAVGARAPVFEAALCEALSQSIAAESRRQPRFAVQRLWRRAGALVRRTGVAR
ncbi:MAG: hypothetical protein JWP65_1097 [Ramlibacter sp.]|uniref:hypothetical protein n=1 Tax=Ramlibacter sp. TaxID=1917967 RepID=UPI00261C0465|nr:hypothetical protein [Ramlibacter sp.]MDB5750676.1 hypothetical protein [Ramlibacter sp.]